MAENYKIIDATSPSSDVCHFLALPGELRNGIYRYAIVEDDTIIVLREGPSEPALLRACSIIRQEAISIYHDENDFTMHMYDWNGVPMLPYVSQLRSAIERPFNGGIGPRGPAFGTEWYFQLIITFTKMKLTQKYLLKCIELGVFRGGLTSEILPHSEDTNDYTIGGTQQIIASMYVPSWARFENVLHDFYLALKVTNFGRVKVEDNVILMKGRFILEVAVSL